MSLTTSFPMMVMKGLRIYNGSVRKKLGQHFIRSERVAQSVVSAAPIDTPLVVEIGPGRGILTAALLDAGHTVIAVEKDDALIALLRERFAGAIAGNRLTLCHGDVRDNGWRSSVGESPHTVVANIPYYLTGSLIRQMLTAADPPSAMTLVVQKEVAERICVRDGKESLLSLSVRLFGVPRYIKKLPRRLFSPQPAVDSAIITITDIHPRPQKVQEVFFDCIHTAFHHKRKSVLKKFQDNPAVRNALIERGVSERARAEEVSFAVWLGVAERGVGEIG